MGVGKIRTQNFAKRMYKQLKLQEFSVNDIVFVANEILKLLIVDLRKEFPKKK